MPHFVPVTVQAGYIVNLTNKRILLGVTGGIAAYKSAELLRRLQDQGAEIRVVMTRGAQEFITPLTMQALSGYPVQMDLLDTENESVMGHIELARWADLLLIAPATADFIARLVAGRGDDLLTTICLAATCRIAIAPAMNQAMWSNSSTQSNMGQLRESAIIILQPDAGLQACGETGVGRLMEVPDMVNAVNSMFDSGTLQGRKVVITAGPTREAIDPVRYISNHSSGKQGYALAQAAVEAGAHVELVTGPTQLPIPDRVHVHQVESALEMHDAVQATIDDAHIFIGVAAVGDYRPTITNENKIKKQSDNGLTLQLVQNPDILGSVAERAHKPFTVGFAAETESLIEHAKEKLEKKNLDMIIANSVGNPQIGFNSDDNQTLVLTKAALHELPRMSKTELARKLIALIAEEIG